MGASAKVTTNAPAIPDTRVMMFPLLVLEMKERGERHKGSGGSNAKPTEVPPCYHREFAQATCAIFSYAEAGFWQGAGKKSGASGEATPRGGPRAQIAVLSGKILQPYGGP
jgi:hypothetical protein